MENLTSSIRIVCVAMLAMTPVAYGQQTQSSGMSGGQMQGMGGMQNSKMGGMDMRTMMKHCAQMHQQMSQSQPMSSKMHEMLAQCAQTDGEMKGGQMGGMTMSAPAPDATRSR